jgi:hypothetical protein
MKSYDDKYRGRRGVVNEIHRKFVSKVMTSRSSVRSLLVTAFVFGIASPLWGDDPKDENTLAKEFLVVAKREAAAYTIRHVGSDRPLALRAEPIMKWSNPVVGSIYGDVFIWTENGRPEAVASISELFR